MSADHKVDPHAVKSHPTGKVRRKGAGLVALLDQAVVSGTHFASSVLLARYCTEAEYGSYMVAFSALLVLIGLQNATLCDPLTFIYPSLKSLAAPLYATGQLLGQGLLATGSVIACGITAFLMSHLIPYSPTANAFLGLTFALALVLSRDFLRRMLYAGFHQKAALVSSLLYSATVLGVLTSLLLTNRLAAGPAFAALGAGGLAASVYGFLYLRHTFHGKPSRRNLKRAFRMNWMYARWGLLGMLGQYGYIHAGTFMVAGLLGPTGAAQLHAARNLLIPIELLMTGLTNTIAPRASAMHARTGRTALNHYLARSGMLAVGAAALYAAVVFFMATPLLKILYGNKYSDADGIVRLWCVVLMCFALRRFPTIGLGALRRPHVPVLAGLLGGMLAIGLYAFMIQYAGVAGAVTTRIFSEVLVLIIVLGAYVSRARTRPTGSTSAR